MEIIEHFEEYEEMMKYKDLASRISQEVRVYYDFDFCLIEVAGKVFYKVVILIYGKEGKEKRKNKL